MDSELARINSEIESIELDLKSSQKQNLVKQSFDSALNRVTQPLGINEPSELAADTINNMSLGSHNSQSILDELRHLHSHGKVHENLDSMLLTQAVVLNRLFHHSLSSNDAETAIKASDTCRRVVDTLKKAKPKHKKSEVRFCEKSYINENMQKITEYYDYNGDLVTLIG
jgi:hypothetical protein